MNSKERCLSVIKGVKADKVPVFPLLMFFAQSRAGIDYKTFSINGHALAEAQLNMRERFNIDAVTVCSDAFRLPADLGADMVFPADKPPFAASPLIKSESDLRKLRKPNLPDSKSRMFDRIIGIRELSANVGSDCLVMGWVDMPFAEACSVCGISNFMMMIFENPPLAHKILSLLTDLVIDFSLMQLEAGAPAIGAGDAAASLISEQLYEEFALPYEQKVCSAIHNKGGLVKLHICGNTTHLLEKMALSGADLYNVDHLVDLSLAKNVYDKYGLCYKGNLDPVSDMLSSTPEECGKKSLECIKIAGESAYMLSAGCEIPAGTSDEVFRAFCEAEKK